MVDALRGLGVFVIAGLATTFSLGHLQLAAPHHQTTPVHAQAGARALDVISGQFMNGMPGLPALSTVPPVVTDSAPPPAPAEVPAAGGYTGYAQPSGGGGGGSHTSAPPAITIGSGQQALINSDRAAAGLPPLQWSSCLAGVAYSNAVRMANAGAISHAGGTSADFGCGLGSSQTGENVGWTSAGINDGQLNTMFMNSPDHRANIMGPYRYVGTAWKVAANGAGYIAVEFG
ncbi:MAG TPA: CAP domain-containing protein [Candidatus Dormibacteraeota bacterium]|jgi:uncharacterized protein YkwD